MADTVRSLRVVPPVFVKTRPHESNALVAGLQVVRNRTMTAVPGAKRRAEKWMTDLWSYFDEIGEFRRGVEWLGKGMSRVNLTGAATPASVGDEPVAIDLDADDVSRVQRRAVELVEFVAGGPDGQGLLMKGFGELFAVEGLAWVIAEPALDDAGESTDMYDRWTTFSSSSVEVDERDDDVVVKVKDDTDKWRTVHRDSLVLCGWRSHPNQRWRADSPARAALPILELLHLYQSSLAASARSMIVGNGILAMPLEVEFASTPTTSPNDEADDEESSFAETLLDYASIAYDDPRSAAAATPLVVQVPGEYLDKIRHITLASPYDAAVPALLEQQIGRLATAIDIPEDVLTGKADLNHWTAWQVADEAITLHIEPPAEIVAQMLTVGYLRPALDAEGFTAEEVRSVMVWYSTHDLKTPPDKSGNVLQAFDRNAAGRKALLRELGLSGEDAPEEAELREIALLSVARGLPSAAPGILNVLGLLSDDEAAKVVAMMNPQAAGGGEPIPSVDSTEPVERPPSRDNRPGAAAEDVLVAATDGIVRRALERANNRLRAAVGKNNVGGSVSVPVPADGILRLHLDHDASQYAPLDSLLADAWEPVADVAEWLGVDSDALTAALDTYTRALIAARHPHTREQLRAALCGIGA